MKFPAIVLMVLFSSVSVAQVEGERFTDKMALQEKNIFIRKSNFKENQDYGWYDLIYQRMEWSIDPGVRYIKGEVTSWFKSTVDNLSEIEFDLSGALMVDSIVQGNQQIGFIHEEDKIRIQLTESLQNHQIDSVCIYYQGEPFFSGLGTFSKSEHAGVPVIWTLSEPYGAMEWWPCKQSLSDKIDSIDVIVNSPEPYFTASNGILVSETTGNGIRRMHWKHRYPIATYLVAISITDYARYSDFLELDDDRQIEILNYVYPEDLDYARAHTPATASIMRLFNELVGEYPFAAEKYGHAQFGWSGGMEHQTMSFMGNFSFNLVAHELAHQWFGNYITLGSWQDIWLNEGFATYLTGLAIENLKNNPDWYNWKKENVERITNDSAGSVFVHDTTNISRIFNSRLSYSKGAYLLHMLRWIMGDEDFFMGIRNYFNDPKIANGFARTQNLVEHLEMAGDTSLTEFFEDWFLGEGFPIYSVAYHQENQNTLKIRMSQTPSHESVGFFEMPVPVRVYSFGKTDSVDFVLNTIENDQEFTVNPGFMIADIKVDPEYWLVSKTTGIVSGPLTKNGDEIQVFPNPFSSELTVSVPINQLPVQIDLFSTEGKLLQQHNLTGTNFSLANLVNGIYFLHIKTPYEVFKTKIIKY